MQQRGMLLYLVLGILFILGALPLLFMFYGTLETTDGLSLDAYKKMLQTPALWQSFQNSLSLGLVVAFLTTAAGTFLGVLIGKTTLLFRHFLLILLLIPLLIPPYILAYSWFGLLGRETLLGTLLFGFWGTAFILFSIYLPIPILLTILFIRQINPKLEESALLICGWPCVLKNITLPLIAPAMVFSFLLVFILSFGEFSVANFLRYNVFPTESFTQFSAFYDFKTATVSAMPMLLIALIVIFIERRTSGKVLRFSTPYQPILIALGKRQIPFLLIVALLTVITVLLPLLSLLWQIDGESFALALEKAFAPLSRSVLFAALGATLLLFFGLLSAYGIENRLRGWKLLDGMMLFLFILPSTLIGIALILFWNRPYTNFIYGTVLIILFGYVVKYLFLSSKIIERKLAQIPHSLVESAELTGASPLQILWFIIIPLTKESLIIAWLIGFIFSLRESTITMLVYPAGLDTLPLYIFTQMANGKPQIVASLCLIMIGIVILPLGLYFLSLYFTKKGAVVR